MRPALYAIVLFCALPVCARTAERQYLFAFSVTEETPQGNKRKLAEPNLVTLEGRPATFLNGGTVAVPDRTKKGEIHFVDFGFSLKLSGTRTKDGACRLDLSAEYIPQPSDQGIRNVKTQRLRLVKTVRPNEPVKATMGAYTVQLRVKEIEPLDGR